MEILGMVLVVAGAIVSLVYGIKLLIIAFQTSIWWGLGYLFVPFVALIFIIVHWDKAGSPFLKSLIAIPLFIAGMACMPTA